MRNGLRFLLIMALFVAVGFIPHKRRDADDTKTTKAKTITIRKENRANLEFKDTGVMDSNATQKSEHISSKPSLKKIISWLGSKMKRSKAGTAKANSFNEKTITKNELNEGGQQSRLLVTIPEKAKAKRKLTNLNAKPGSKDVTGVNIKETKRRGLKHTSVNLQNIIAKLFTKKSSLRSKDQTKTTGNFLAKKGHLARLRAKNKPEDVSEEINLKVTTNNGIAKQKKKISRVKIKLEPKDIIAANLNVPQKNELKPFSTIQQNFIAKSVKKGQEAGQKSESETDKEIIEFLPNDFETKDVSTTAPNMKRHKRTRAKMQLTEETTYSQTPKRKKHRVETAEHDRQVKLIDYQPISNIIIILSEKFYTEKKLELLDSAIFFNNKVRRIRIDYSTMDTLTMWESRKILVDVVEDLLGELNGNGEVTALLENAPLTPYDFEIVVHTGSYYTHILDLQSVGLITLKKGIAHYIASNAFNQDFTDCWDKRSETYDQSKNFVFSKREGENLYRPKKEEKASYFGQERYKTSDKDKRIMY